MKKILVIDDEPDMRRNISALLRYYDYEPIVAENRRVGIETARREKPDLILCDVMMPELNGYSVLQTLQTDAALARIPFIFLTAKGDKKRAARRHESWRRRLPQSNVAAPCFARRRAIEWRLAAG